LNRIFANAFQVSDRVGLNFKAFRMSPKVADRFCSRRIMVMARVANISAHISSTTALGSRSGYRARNLFRIRTESSWNLSRLRAFETWPGHMR
jgi:hypothetical protein